MMLNLEGEIGVLYQDGKQVAGIYNWAIRVVLHFTTVNEMKHYIPSKHIDAGSYWLVEPVVNNTFYAEFYQVINDNLVMMDAGNVAIDFPDCHTIDRRLDAPVEVKWVGVEY